MIEFELIFGIYEIFKINNVLLIFQMFLYGFETMILINHVNVRKLSGLAQLFNSTKDDWSLISYEDIRYFAHDFYENPEYLQISNIIKNYLGLVS